MERASYSEANRAVRIRMVRWFGTAPQQCGPYPDRDWLSHGFSDATR